MFKELRAAVILFLFLMLATGLAYPMLVLGLGRTLFPWQANGSLIEADGKIIGSSLIGQNFTGEKYFHPRPSAANYDAANSSGSNLGPTSADLLKSVAGRVAEWKKTAGAMAVPADLVTTSASGLDPHISPAAAQLQAPRVATARGIALPEVEELVMQYTAPPTFGVLGENRVDVLGLNRALDAKIAAAR